MAEASAFEGTGLVNNGDGITLKYAATIVENSFFAVNYAIQNHLNAAKLYRKNHFSTLIASLLDYCHIIPFLVHRKTCLLPLRCSTRLSKILRGFRQRDTTMEKSPWLGQGLLIGFNSNCPFTLMLPTRYGPLLKKDLLHILTSCAHSRPLIDCLLGDGRLECHSHWALCLYWIRSLEQDSRAKDCYVHYGDCSDNGFPAFLPCSVSLLLHQSMINDESLCT